MRRFAIAIAIAVLVHILGLVLLTATGTTATAAEAVGSATPAPLASSVVSSAPAPGGAAGTTHLVRLPFGGVDRTYRVFVPTALPAGPRPLVLLLHGLTSSASLMEARGADVEAGTSGSLVAYPEGLGASWNEGVCCGPAFEAGADDVGFLSAVIADVSVRVKVDPARLAIGGHSNGALMAYRFACQRSDLVDVVFAVASVNLRGCTPSRPVSLLHVHGLADTTAPYAGTTLSALTGTALPSVGQSVLDWAAASGCGTAFTTSAYQGRADVALYAFPSCPSGVSIELVRSKLMTHTWPVTSTEVTRTGVAPTSMLWTFTAKAWAGRPVVAPTSTSVSAAAAPGGAAGRTTVVSISRPQGPRTYRLFAPASLPQGTRPLVLLLHGAGSSGAVLEAKGADLGAPAADAFVAYPEAARGAWAAGDVDFLAEVVADVSRRVHVDSRRVLVGGHATGGNTAYEAGCQRPDLFAGVFVVAGTNTSTACVPARPVSLLHVHGQSDSTAPYTTAANGVVSWAAATGCGSTFGSSPYAGRTDVTSYAYPACPAGTAVELIRSKAMTHAWPVTDAEVLKTGVQPSAILWSWVAKVRPDR